MKQHSVAILSKREDHAESRDITTEGTTEKDIRQRAYELYEKHGCLDGRAVEDWLEAEKEIRKARLAVA